MPLSKERTEADGHRRFSEAGVGRGGSEWTGHTLTGSKDEVGCAYATWTRERSQQTRARTHGSRRRMRRRREGRSPSGFVDGRCWWADTRGASYLSRDSRGTFPAARRRGPTEPWIFGGGGSGTWARAVGDRDGPEPGAVQIASVAHDSETTSTRPRNSSRSTGSRRRTGLVGM